MSAKHPTPWRVVADAIHPTTKATIFDDNGEPILPYVNGYGVLYPHTAEFIVEAVNERDRLRDLVRGLADNLRRFHITGDRDKALLREAREAIGEDKE